MDGLHIGPPTLGLRPLGPLDGSKAEANPPPAVVGEQPPPPEAGNLPLQPEDGNELPQGVQLTYPQKERELLMA